MNPSKLLWIGVALIFVGFFVAALGSFIAAGNTTTSIGGFILIGPIPIVFGSGPNSGVLAEVGLAITLVMVVIYLLSFFLWRSGRRSSAEARTESE